MIFLVVIFATILTVLTVVCLIDSRHGWGWPDRGLVRSVSHKYENDRTTDFKGTPI